MNDNILLSRIAADRRRHDRQVFRRPTTEAICGDFIWMRFRLSGPSPSLPAGINVKGATPPGALPARPAQIGQGITDGNQLVSLTLHGFAAE